MSAAAAAALAAASIYVYVDVGRGLPSRFVSAGRGCSPALPRRDARVAAGCPAGLAVPVGGRHAFRGCPKIAEPSHPSLSRGAARGRVGIAPGGAVVGLRRRVGVLGGAACMLVSLLPLAAILPRSLRWLPGAQR